MYSASSPIGGLHNGSVYTVLDAGTNLIRLGSILFTSGVDPLQETITFGSPHPYQSGDCVYYQRGAGTAILPARAEANVASCTNTTSSATDRVFFVRKLDDFTIKLYNRSDLATAADETPYTVTVFSPSQLQLSAIPGGLLVGTPIVYHAQVTATFGTGAVDVTPVSGFLPPPNNTTPAIVPQTGACPGGECGVTLHNDGGKNILLDATTYAALTAGQAVRYVARNGVALGNLTNGGTYYVIKIGNNSIRLAGSYCDAVGSAGDASCALPDGSDAGDDPDPSAGHARSRSRSSRPRARPARSTRARGRSAPRAASSRPTSASSSGSAPPSTGSRPG